MADNSKSTRRARRRSQTPTIIKPSEIKTNPTEQNNQPKKISARRPRIIKPNKQEETLKLDEYEEFGGSDLEENVSNKTVQINESDTSLIVPEIVLPDSKSSDEEYKKKDLIDDGYEEMDYHDIVLPIEIEKKEKKIISPRRSSRRGSKIIIPQTHDDPKGETPLILNPESNAVNRRSRKNSRIVKPTDNPPQEVKEENKNELIIDEYEEYTDTTATVIQQDETEKNTQTIITSSEQLKSINLNTISVNKGNQEETKKMEIKMETQTDMQDNDKKEEKLDVEKIEQKTAVVQPVSDDQQIVINDPQVDEEKKPQEARMRPRRGRKKKKQAEEEKKEEQTVEEEKKKVQQKVEDQIVAEEKLTEEQKPTEPTLGVTQEEKSQEKIEEKDEIKSKVEEKVTTQKLSEGKINETSEQEEKSQEKVAKNSEEPTLDEQLKTEKIEPVLEKTTTDKEESLSAEKDTIQQHSQEEIAPKVETEQQGETKIEEKIEIKDIQETKLEAQKPQETVEEKESVIQPVSNDQQEKEKSKEKKETEEKSVEEPKPAELMLEVTREKSREKIKEKDEIKPMEERSRENVEKPDPEQEKETKEDQGGSKQIETEPEEKKNEIQSLDQSLQEKGGDEFKEIELQEDENQPNTESSPEMLKKNQTIEHKVQSKPAVKLEYFIDGKQQVEVGEKIVVRWTITSGEYNNSSSWIGLFNAEDQSNSKYLTYKWIDSQDLDVNKEPLTGSLIFYAPFEYGEYIFKFFDTRTGLPIATSQKIRVASSVKLECQATNEKKLKIFWKHQIVPEPYYSWIGLYKKEEKNDYNYISYDYCYGKKFLLLPTPTTAGAYEIRFFVQKYQRAAMLDVNVEAITKDTIIASLSPYFTVTVDVTLVSVDPYYDSAWIGVFKSATKDNNQYIHHFPIKKKLQVVRITAPREKGEYELRLFVQNKSEPIVKSNKFVIQ